MKNLICFLFIGIFLCAACLVYGTTQTEEVSPSAGEPSSKLMQVDNDSILGGKSIWAWCIVIIVNDMLLIFFIILIKSRLEDKLVATEEDLKKRQDNFKDECRKIRMVLEKELNRKRNSSARDMQHNCNPGIATNNQLHPHSSELPKTIDLRDNPIKSTHISKTKHENFKFPPPLTTQGFPNELSDDQGNSYFRFFNIKDDIADFEFCGNDISRARANKDEIAFACEFVGSSENARDIKNIEKGSVILKNYRWEITQKAKIQFV
jgi:hypothetical protein